MKYNNYKSERGICDGVYTVTWINFALFYNGEYVMNETPNEKKFLGIIEQIRSVEK